jgi:OOP family OmpA-OmpF porin
MQSRYWGVCAAVGGLAGGIGGGLGGRALEPDEEDSDRGPIIAGGVVGGLIIGAIAGHLICDPVVPPPALAQAPPPPPPPPPPAPTPPPTGTRLATLRGPNFDFNKAEIKPDGRKILDDVVTTMKENPTLRVSVEGHTDSVGSDTYNQALSERRAASVVQYLVGRGIDAGRMSTRAYGESKPIASNDTAEGRAQNRRVEIIAQ